LPKFKEKKDKSLDNYISRFRIMKARYMTMVAEYEFVLMATPCLNYAVRKKWLANN